MPTTHKAPPVSVLLTDHWLKEDRMGQVVVINIDSCRFWSRLDLEGPGQGYWSPNGFPISKMPFVTGNASMLQILSRYHNATKLCLVHDKAQWATVWSLFSSGTNFAEGRREQGWKSQVLIWDLIWAEHLNWVGSWDAQFNLFLRTNLSSPWGTPENWG